MAVATQVAAHTSLDVARTRVTRTAARGLPMGRIAPGAVLFGQTVVEVRAWRSPVAQEWRTIVLADGTHLVRPTEHVVTPADRT